MFFTERIDEVRNEIFVFGAIFEDFFFVSNNNFVIGDFNDFFARNSEIGVNESFHSGAMNDNLLDDEIFGCDGEVD